MRRFPAIILCSSLLFAADLSPQAKSWWSHIEYLADDKLEGRNTGSEGYRQAARYVEDQFRKAGLSPAGTTGYEQPVQFQSRVVVESQSSLALVRNGQVSPLAIGDDAIIGVRGGIPGSIEAPLVFVGYGLTVPEQGYDDLKGLDLRGKVAVFLAGGPASIPGALRSHYGSAAERGKFLHAAGVVGAITVQNPKSMDVPWDRAKLARFSPSMVLADPALQDGAELKVTLGMNPASMDKLLAGSGHTFAEILAAADAERPLPKFVIPASLRANVMVKTDTAMAPNVIGRLPGNDTKLKDEYVVLSAHLDHLGVGQPIGGDKIYNGAMDDASGIATLIEVANAMKGLKLQRSVLFIAVCGEEKGLLGSKFFAAHPTVGKRQMVADLNLDMFMPLHPLKKLMVLGADQSTLGQPLQVVTKEFGVTLQPDPEPNRNRFVRSDQYSFILQGVPSLAFKFGYDAGSAEEKLHQEWLKNRYHAPSDDLQQPVDKEAAAKFDQIIAALLRNIANAEARPRWNEDSFFKRFAAAE